MIKVREYEPNYAKAMMGKKQIDQEVYKLYDLDDDEIKIIETK